MPAASHLALAASIPSPSYGIPAGGDVGTGTERTYFTGVRAEAHVDAEMRVAFTPAPTTPLRQRYFHVELDPYLVLQGRPQGRPEYHARMYSRCGLGEYEYTDEPVSPLSINTKASCRWLPTDSSWTQDSSWQPTTGGGFGLTMTPENAPYLDESYSWSVRGGDETEGQAVVFDGDSWLQASNRGWSASGFTVAMVAVFGPNSAGSRTYGVLSSFDTEDVGTEVVSEGEEEGIDLPPPPVDWSIRYRQGTLQVMADSTVVTHEVAFPIGRPVMLAIAMDGQEGKLFVCDRTKSSRSFSTAGMRIFDQELIIGRQTGRTDSAATANMELLDLNWYDHALDWAELSDLLSELDSAYGIVG